MTELDDDLFSGKSSGSGYKKLRHVADEEELEVPIGEVEYIHDVPLKMIAQIGHIQKSLKEVLGLHKGSVIEFDKVVGEPVDILIGGRLMCRGEIVVVNERYGIRISEVVRADDSNKTPGE